MIRQSAPKADALPGCAIPRSPQVHQNTYEKRAGFKTARRDTERNSIVRAVWEQEVPGNFPTTFSRRSLGAPSPVLNCGRAGR